MNIPKIILQARAESPQWGNHPRLDLPSELSSISMRRDRFYFYAREIKESNEHFNTLSHLIKFIQPEVTGGGTYYPVTLILSGKKGKYDEPLWAVSMYYQNEYHIIGYSSAYSSETEFFDKLEKGSEYRFETDIFVDKKGNPLLVHSLTPFLPLPELEATDVLLIAEGEENQILMPNPKTNQEKYAYLYDAPRYYPKPHQVRNALAEITIETVDSGKHKGSQVLAITDRELQIRIGEFTVNKSAKYMNLVQQKLSTGKTVVVETNIILIWGQDNYVTQVCMPMPV